MHREQKLQNARKSTHQVAPRAKTKLVHYRMRSKISYSQDTEQRKRRADLPYIFGRVLYGNQVMCSSLLGSGANSLREKHWENCRYIQDVTGVKVYPPYVEASGYLLSRPAVNYLLQEEIPWRGSEWAVEDSTMGTLFAGTRLRWVMFPYEILSTQRVLKPK